eukprot:GGOE01060366.1.p3 GENE.GGOE01060366.1~~GGOE01060366.1.p3  ORF type:complete len:117 (+),score=9.83 GGOE01060366.1:73-423(+)
MVVITPPQSPTVILLVCALSQETQRRLAEVMGVGFARDRVGGQQGPPPPSFFCVLSAILLLLSLPSQGWQRSMTWMSCVTSMTWITIVAVEMCGGRHFLAHTHMREPLSLLLLEDG